MERIDAILKRRADVAWRYSRELKEIDEIETPYVASGVKMGWFVYVIRLKKYFTRTQRDVIVKRLEERGIECATYFAPIHLQPFYRKMFGYTPGDFPVTEHTADRTIALPFYSNLQTEKIHYVVGALKQIISNLRRQRQ
jgi:perosamine synthetase